MFELSTLRRSLQYVALAVCSLIIAFAATPASARTHHGSSHHHVHAHSMRHHTTRHFFRHHRSAANSSRWERGVAQMHTNGFGDTQASLASNASSNSMTNASGFGDSSVVSEARQYIGGNPTSRGSLWCARFMNMVLEKTGHHGTGSDMARSFASYGQRVSGPQVGAIAVMGRRGGGHVGVVSGVDAQGNPILISGNNGNRVREAAVSRGRIYAYVMPN